ncbi:hypothetical protein QYF36_026076 [Acer negundo]|nr:hypothetical protein QYF36_026076 [Acer negundo]
MFRFFHSSANFCKQHSVLRSSLPFVTNQTKSQPQEWPLRLHKTIGCQLRGIVTILAPPPGNSLRSVVVVAVIVTLSQALLRNSWSWRAKNRRLR